MAENPAHALGARPDRNPVRIPWQLSVQNAAPHRRSLHTNNRPHGPFQSSGTSSEYLSLGLTESKKRLESGAIRALPQPKLRSFGSHLRSALAQCFRRELADTLAGQANTRNSQIFSQKMKSHLQAIVAKRETTMRVNDGAVFSAHARHNAGSVVEQVASILAFLPNHSPSRVCQPYRTPNHCSCTQQFRCISSTDWDWLVPEVGLEPTCLAAEDFESSASTIPPLGPPEPGV